MRYHRSDIAMVAALAFVLTATIDAQELTPNLTVSLPGGATMGFMRIEAGTLTMGDVGLGATPHQVTLTHIYYLGQCEVTQGQWQSVMATTPWDCLDGVLAAPVNPAVWISWDDAQSFVHALNQAAGDSMYRLPTEAEWEYACRAGTATLWSSGATEGTLGPYAWYAANTWDIGLTWAQPVAAKLPTPARWWATACTCANCGPGTSEP